jgi:CotS family spore coat protein
LYSQPELILEQYDFTVNEITKGRGIYICDTSLGKKVLTPFRGSKERAVFLRELLLYLKEHGTAAEQLVVTKEGEVLAADEMGQNYLLKDLVTGDECSTRHPEQMCAVVEALAEVHLCLEECPLAIPEFMAAEKSPVSAAYAKHERELVKVKNYVKSRNRKNEFEMKFQKEYPHFAAQAAQSVALLEECGKNTIGRNLCHGDFNQHNAVRTGQGWQIINYEKINCSGPMSDLSTFLRKMMEKNDWDRELGMKLIRSYERIRPLERDEYRQLLALMLFPEKFWKLANHYYNSHKAWVSGRSIEKLDRMMAQEGRRENFLEYLNIV